jgi:iron(III) transport system ATP-binding protein
VGLDGFGERLPHQLSGGQQQRVALARALAPQPDILLLDEPFSNLDPSLRIQVRADVRAILKQAKTTAILVTHDQEEALSLADQIAMLIDGEIVQRGRPEDLYHRPATRAVASFIGDAQFLVGESRGETVVTALGSSPAATSGNGPVDVLIRPEMIVLIPDTDEGSSASGSVSGSVGGGVRGSVPGRIVSRKFFGHDQVITIELGHGETIEARVGGHYPVFPGSRVRLGVRGVVQTFPPH